MAMTAQERIDIGGNWEFQIDREDVGISEKWWEKKKLEDKIKLPGSMPERMKGDDISVNTQWVGSLYDSSYFYNPYMEKYRQPGKMKLQFFLTPEKHYVGAAWYRRTVVLKEYDSKARYTIYLERPHIETTLYVNGDSVGRQNSLCVAHEYDVTEHLKAGKNVIAIRGGQQARDGQRRTGQPLGERPDAGGMERHSGQDGTAPRGTHTHC